MSGLDVGNTIDRLGAFMAENGGSYMNKTGTAFSFDSPQNVAALNWFVKYDKAGIFKLNSQQGAGWAGQAFGEGEAAMATEGSWIIGGMASYPNIKWIAVPMPAGPTGIKGTLTFTDCWGVAAQTKYSKAAVSLVKYLSSPSVETYNAKAFGPLPPRPAVAAAYAKADPLLSAFIAGTPYAMPQVETVGWSTVQARFRRPGDQHGQRHDHPDDAAQAIADQRAGVAAALTALPERQWCRPFRPAPLALGTKVPACTRG